MSRAFAAAALLRSEGSTDGFAQSLRHTFVVRKGKPIFVVLFAAVAAVIGSREKSLNQAALAQLVEQALRKRQDVCSSQTSGTNSPIRQRS